MVAGICAKMRFCLLLVLVSRIQSQLVLDDVVEDGGGAAPQAGLMKEATNPLTQALQWGVDNSDQAAMAERAKAIREGKAEPMKLDRELMDALFGTKASFLEKAVAGLHAAIDENDEDKILEALEIVEEQATDIDNANDLDRVDGVAPTIRLLSHPSTKVRTAALWVIGTTAQSNPAAQEMLMNYRVLPTLMSPIVDMNSAGTLAHADPKLIAKSLYAISTLLRGCGLCLEGFLTMDGQGHLSRALSVVSREANAEPWLPVMRKLVALVGDLVLEESAPAAAATMARHFSSASSAATAASGEGHEPAGVASSVARMLVLEDRELQEKSIQALLNILSVEPKAADAMGKASLAEALEVVVLKAQRKMQGGDDATWEEPLVLGRQLLLALGNSTA